MISHEKILDKVDPYDGLMWEKNEILKAMELVAKQAFDAGQEREDFCSPYSKYLTFEDYLKEMS